VATRRKVHCVPEMQIHANIMKCKSVQLLLYKVPVKYCFTFSFLTAHYVIFL